jgi:integrase
VIRKDLERACRDAGIADYHPHTLRHRRSSPWLADGFETASSSSVHDIAERRS